MIDCDDIIGQLYQHAREQVELAVIAERPEIAAMHIDLALFNTEQLHIAEELCADT